MDKKLLFIVNQASGRKRQKEGIVDAVEVFCKAGYSVNIHILMKSEDAAAYTEKNAGKYDIVVCGGGDGTLSRVVNGLMSLEDRPPLGYIPMGTANDLATSLGLRFEARGAALDVVNGRVALHDVGMAGEKYFSYIAAFGAFTEVAYQTPQEQKQALGQLAYILEGMRHLSGITPRRIRAEYDGGIIEGDYVFGSVSNSTSVAGLVKLKQIDVALDDGEFEVILIKKPKNVTELQRILSGVLNLKFDPEYVYLFHTSKIRFEFDKETAWTIDGEDGGAFCELSLRNEHQSLKMIVPGGERGKN